MAEHLSEQDLEQYQRRALAPAELLVADSHLATCDQCHQRITKGRDYLSSVRDSLTSDVRTELGPEDDHLSYDQLAALVDDEIDDVRREIATVHLEVCQKCAAELTGLQELKVTLPTSQAQPLPMATQRRPAQLLLNWRQPDWWAWPRLAAAALVLLVAVTLVWILWRSIRQTRTEVVESPHVNANVATASPAPLQPSPAPNASPKMVLVLKDGGGEVTMDEAGNVSGPGALSTTPVSEAVKTALKTQRLNIAPAIEGLRGKGGTLMGAPSEGVPFALIAPLGSVVRSIHPTLRWQPLEGVSVYVVKVYDTNFKEVVSSTPQTTTEWKITAPLSRGAIYIWQVTANRDGEEVKSPVPPAPEARFKVLDRDKEVEVERVTKTYVNSHLVLGTVYAEAGLLNEAEREFSLLLKANPNSQVAKELLRGVSAAQNPKR